MKFNKISNKCDFGILWYMAIPSRILSLQTNEEKKIIYLNKRTRLIKIVLENEKETNEIKDCSSIWKINERYRLPEEDGKSHHHVQVQPKPTDIGDMHENK